MDDYDEDKQWEKAGKQGNKIRKKITKELKGNKVLKILDDITPELYADDDSDTSRWRYHSGSDDLERHNYLKKELKNMSTKEKNELLKRYAKNPNTLLKRPLSNLAAVEDSNLYNKNPDKWRLKMDQTDRLRQAQLKALQAELDAIGKPKQQAVNGWGPRISAVNDNIMKATNRMGAKFAVPTTLGSAAAGYLATKYPAAMENIKGFTKANLMKLNKLNPLFANPWVAALGGIFAPSQIANSEYIGSPEHQVWLANKGPLAKYPE